MNTTILKIIAVIAMFIDHVGFFIPNTPEWFGWIGRIAVPIFIFTIVIGFQYTSDRKKYLTRLYMFSLGMSFINLLVNYIFRDFSIADLTNNFFAPLFLIVLILSLIEKKQLKYIFLFSIWQIISLVLCSLLADIIEFPSFNSATTNAYFWGSIFGNIFAVEGGPLFILMGIFLYLARDRKINIVIVYTIFSFCCFYSSYKWGHLINTWNNLLFPFTSYQWTMISAVPLILLYNSKRGKGLKYFFYIFYPAHIIILYLIGFYLKNPPPLGP
ncbi:TraX family protein [Lysinibacillus xylanilyticus]|uniref:TraX family protein n=1 Tax=Lysinibacillus xylanilyticus TaxID=582475 RepID=UPI00381731F2